MSYIEAAFETEDEAFFLKALETLARAMRARGQSDEIKRRE